MGRTMYQLKVLGWSAAERVSIERRMAIDAVRVGSHADAKQYKEYLRSLEPPIPKKKTSKRPEKNVDTESVDALTKMGLRIDTDGSRN